MVIQPVIDTFNTMAANLGGTIYAVAYYGALTLAIILAFIYGMRIFKYLGG